MPDPIATDRLLLTPWSPADHRALGELARDPSVTRHIGAGEPWDAARVDEVHASMLAHWAEHGFGWRSACEREGGKHVGFAGVAHLGDNQAGLDPAELELGCWIRPGLWRHGYAREASAAVLAEAFGRGAGSVIVVIRADHAASIAGSRSLGFEPEAEVDWLPSVRAVVMRLGAAAGPSRSGTATAFQP